jgi:hypothetical protein
MSAAAGSQLSMLQLYRHILKAAQQFPSIKRPSIIQLVKTEFRENKVGCIFSMPAVITPVAIMICSILLQNCKLRAGLGWAAVAITAAAVCACMLHDAFFDSCSLQLSASRHAV